MGNLRRKLVATLFSVGLAATLAYAPARAVEYNIPKEPIKKIRTTSTFLGGGYLFNVEIEKTLTDGTRIIETDWYADGEINNRKVIRKLPDGTRTEEDYNADGELDHIETVRTLADGTRIKTMDYDADGKTDSINTLRKTIDGTIEETDSNADGEIDFTETVKELADGTKVNTLYEGKKVRMISTEKKLDEKTTVWEYDVWGDGKIDFKQVEKQVDKETKRMESWGSDGKLSFVITTTDYSQGPENYLKITEIDYDGDDKIDNTIMESRFPDGTTITRDDSDPDGHTIESIVEFNLIPDKK